MGVEAVVVFVVVGVVAVVVAVEVWQESSEAGTQRQTGGDRLPN